jgi:hypothetical protein
MKASSFLEKAVWLPIQTSNMISAAGARRKLDAHADLYISCLMHFITLFEAFEAVGKLS